jgi:hypothetical protein
VFFEGSELLLEWTAQHGCNSGVNNCNIVLQYACDTDPALVTDKALQVQLRDGGATTALQPPATPAANSQGLSAITSAQQQNNGVAPDANGQTGVLKGRHENEVRESAVTTRECGVVHSSPLPPFHLFPPVFAVLLLGVSGALARPFSVFGRQQFAGHQRPVHASEPERRALRPRMPRRARLLSVLGTP